MPVLPNKEIQKGTICWQSDGFCVLVLRESAHDYLQNGQYNEKYYATNLRQCQLKEAIKSKRKLCEGVLWFQDNAPVHATEMAIWFCFRSIKHAKFQNVS